MIAKGLKRRSRFPVMKVNEKNVPTKQCSPQAHPRLSEPDEHPGRSRRHTKTPQQGAQTSECPDTSQTGSALGTRSAPSTFPKAARILARREFVVLQRKGRRRHTLHFVVMTRPRQTGCSRLGITASRRFGNAVMRNRMKRYVREFFRRYQAALVPSQDILVIPQRGAGRLSFHQINRELGRALKLSDDDHLIRNASLLTTDSQHS